MNVNVIAGEDEAIGQWASEQLGCARFQEPFTAFGFTDGDNRLFAASIFNDYYPGGNCEWTHVGPGRFTPEMASFLCRFVFEQLSATRVTAKTRRGNALVRKLLPKYGFTFEGVQKRYFGPAKDDDALVYVLFKEDAGRWLQRLMQ